MTITLIIEVSEKPYSSTDNPDQAKEVWLARDARTGSVGKGETVSAALAACLMNLAYRI